MLCFKAYKNSYPPKKFDKKMKNELSVSEKKNLVPIAIPKLDLSFGSPFQNLVSVINYSKISDFPNGIIDFGSQCLLEASNVVPGHIRMLC